MTPHSSERKQKMSEAAHRAHERRGNDPTPEEIAIAAAEIRETWSEREEAFRRGVRLSEIGNYSIPEVACPARLRSEAGIR